MDRVVQVIQVSHFIDFDSTINNADSKNTHFKFFFIFIKKNIEKNLETKR